MPTSRSHNDPRPTAIVKKTVIFFVVIVLAIAVPLVVFLLTKSDVTITVTDKAIKRTQATKDEPGKDQYLIYTDKGTFKSTDTIFALKFNSSDLYGKLRVGKTYECSATGFRIPFTSSFKNLLKCEQVNR